LAQGAVAGSLGERNLGDELGSDPPATRATGSGGGGSTLALGEEVAEAGELGGAEAGADLAGVAEGAVAAGTVVVAIEAP
jgi:hypothetical protein